MSDQTIHLHARFGRTDDSAAALASKLLVAGPRIVWVEPRPREKRLDNFPGLWIGDAVNTLTLDGIVIDEARLFWADGWVHVVGAGGKTRWAAFRQGAARTAWLDCLPSPAEKEKDWPVMRQNNELLLIQQRDLKRYGLESLAGMLNGKSLQVIEYHQETALVGWRLEVKP